MILVIAEKPSVAQTIAAVLGAKEKKDGFLTGSGYIVSWCVGHLVGLSEAAAYGEQYKKWSYDSLPILPQEWKYTVASDKEKQFKTLKELMHRADVSEVVNACDAGREGELIFRFVYEVAGCRKPTRRLWISSMEEAAIKEGFSHLKNGEAYDALFASALCRAKADWLIGINATRLFSVLYNHTLNVGRVQTPTLKMLVDRDAAITTFKKEKYYHVRLSLSGAEAASEKLSDRSEADRLKAACEASKAVCTSLVKEKKTAAPPKLFDLTSLQREANRLFGIGGRGKRRQSFSRQHLFDQRKRGLTAGVVLPAGAGDRQAVARRADQRGARLSVHAGKGQNNRLLLPRFGKRFRQIASVKAHGRNALGKRLLRLLVRQIPGINAERANLRERRQHALRAIQRGLLAVLIGRRAEHGRAVQRDFRPFAHGVGDRRNALLRQRVSGLHSLSYPL